MTDTDTAIPRPALLLGWAGVIPFAVFAFATALELRLPGLRPEPILLAYAAAILSFMGGAQWGLAIRETPVDGQRLAASVIPALVAWAALLQPRDAGLLLCLVAFLGLLAYDLLTVRQGRSPGWYGALRLQLTGAVAGCLALALLFD
ncbi:MAG TPA: DUF3429 domain-containing protein [Brevundimonas sp.]|jgi:hypothetical protein|uniref:DUF3429 domain-containing protein n=1 Tax=Brevundimonas sp. TaxID=1871086 RepID=UPI002E0D7753|nr:DUF3429 domain-containing protein [Brevundimonas sp.]